MKIKKINRIRILVLGALLLGAVTGIASASTSEQPPNVLFILVDDLNDAVAGWDGHPQAVSPNIARLRSAGVSFVNAHCNFPLCVASRASLFTGVYPHKSGYSAQPKSFRSNPVLKESVTLMEHFRDNGYTVMGTGKLFHHSAGNPDPSIWSKIDGKPAYGWSADAGPWSASAKRPGGGWGTPHPSYPEHHSDILMARLSEVPIHPGDEKALPSNHSGWYLRGKPFRYNGPDDRDLMADEQHVKWVTKRLQKKHDNPFLICVGFHRPHSPLILPDEYVDRFPLDSIQLPEILENDLDDCANILKDINHNYRRLMGIGGEREVKRWIQFYLASVAFVDEQIGALLDELEKSPYADNTVVVLTSDHGYHMGKKERVYKNSLWEESTRVPFIISAPGIGKDATCDHPVSLIDLYPTLIDLCKLPQHPNSKTGRTLLDGFSLLPLLEDPENGRWDGPDVALTMVREWYPENRKPKDMHFEFTVRSKDFRYTRCSNGEEELYDHRKDRHEWHNVADESKYAKEKNELRRQLTEMTEEKKQTGF
ncbi:sulfatase [Pontiella sulfatireligans]|uniref:Arylsulfatase n=1 Tax=Pontiella sulfatireligans TaxID=2750658 RepID=A0A6C2UJW5_9BACT|nr:sulfatase [Pontiella sulfatireligans]SPS74341.1 sulfatase S1_7 [Kiritimatiellales bacterium]VGO19486.1 Arylsulfatase [Pontiella sulfatireligans]